MPNFALGFFRGGVFLFHPNEEFRIRIVSTQPSQTKAAGGQRKNFGGAEGIRTPDPHNAIVVLYQLELRSQIQRPKVCSQNLNFVKALFGERREESKKKKIELAMPDGIFFRFRKDWEM